MPGTFTAPGLRIFRNHGSVAPLLKFKPPPIPGRDVNSPPDPLRRSLIQTHGDTSRRPAYRPPGAGKGLRPSDAGPHAGRALSAFVRTDVRRDHGCAHDGFHVRDGLVVIDGHRALPSRSPGKLGAATSGNLTGTG